MKSIFFSLIVPLILLLPDVSYSQLTYFDTLEIDGHGHTLKGYFFKARSGTKSPTVLFLQGLPGEIGDELDLGKHLSGAGINFFTFNYSGIFASGGKHSLANTIKDINSALAFLTSDKIVRKYQIDTTAIILGGYSFGGGMALTYLQHHPSLSRVFSIAGTDHGQFAHEVTTDSTYMKMMVNYFDKYLKAPAGPIKFVYEKPIDELLRNPDFYHIKLLAAKLSGVDVYLVGALDDRNVTMENHLLPLYRELKKNKGQEVSFRIYQTNHSFRNALSELSQDLIRWIKKDSANH